MKVKPGDKAPDFQLPDQNGRLVSLQDLTKMGVVVLYFYPKDQSYGCTREACAFRDQYEVFREAGAEVVGVSSDSVESHRKFAQRQGLPFLLLSDRDGQVRRTYGVPNYLGLLQGRVTFVIDKEGVVRYVFSSILKFEQHVKKSLELIRSL